MFIKQTHESGSAFFALTTLQSVPFASDKLSGAVDRTIFYEIEVGRLTP